MRCAKTCASPARHRPVSPAPSSSATSCTVRGFVATMCSFPWVSWWTYVSGENWWMRRRTKKYSPMTATSPPASTVTYCRPSGSGLIIRTVSKKLAVPPMYEAVRQPMERATRCPGTLRPRNCMPNAVRRDPEMVPTAPKHRAANMGVRRFPSFLAGGVGLSFLTRDETSPTGLALEGLGGLGLGFSGALGAGACSRRERAREPGRK
mmetsp:Transcript_47574/g.78293  ORF Transcript_47574/g.78293 Transcript_47574/m.78293 type:complete len:207 (+) Transcript_47574:87-707(+)